jgi:hypothetical protein
MDQLVIEIINELVEVAPKSRRWSLWLHADEESTEIARTICDGDHEPKTNIVP